jgi:hypothetical protein
MAQLMEPRGTEVTASPVSCLLSSVSFSPPSPVSCLLSSVSFSPPSLVFL